MPQVYIPPPLNWSFLNPSESFWNTCFSRLTNPGWRWRAHCHKKALFIRTEKQKKKKTTSDRTTAREHYMGSQVGRRIFTEALASGTEMMRTCGRPTGAPADRRRDPSIRVGVAIPHVGSTPVSSLFCRLNFWRQFWVGACRASNVFYFFMLFRYNFFTVKIKILPNLTFLAAE